MAKKTCIITIVVALCLVVGAGLGVLIWWLVSADSLFHTIRLEGDGIGDVDYTAAFTRVNGQGDMFWWFYPTLTSSSRQATSRPLLMWLHGATGLSPSFLANFGMFGPYNVNLNRNNESWVNDYNILLVDAPLGTGFSVKSSDDTNDNIDQNVEHLLRTIQSFFEVHEEYREAPLYICGHADGSQLAIPLAVKLYGEDGITNNFKGLILGNPLVSPSLVLTKLGFYLEELGYIDSDGRVRVDNYTNGIQTLVASESYEQAFGYFTSLEQFINENAGAVAVNLNYIVEKLTRVTNRDYFGERSYLNSMLNVDIDVNGFMNTVVAPALGISGENSYDRQRDIAIQAFNNSYMKPIVDQVEHILENTNLTVAIYNGNLDAVSNTPGQLEWVNNLRWSGQAQFLNASRQTLVINGLVEGYFRESERLRFYWINVAGQLVPLDNSLAIRRVLNRILT
ncbi:retinoid-inducible serine carboxypeptidase-like [Melitaea cinxia]|uniref:retinoid-inducible serine carboxypeptidase-like n=1 Tax=Melitaea cinxia TaxID=113334 RepID=UPI001E26F2A1|nr:retinoid-inducible serine carboxypeptidase-like [Melitaea cinxia]